MGLTLALALVYVGLFSLSDRTADRYIFPAYFFVGAAGTIASSAAFRGWSAWPVPLSRLCMAIHLHHIFVIFGAVLEGLPAMIVFVPVMYPIAAQFGIDPLHYGILIIASIGIGVFLPPIGVALFIVPISMNAGLDRPDHLLRRAGRRRGAERQRPDPALLDRQVHGRAPLPSGPLFRPFCHFSTHHHIWLYP
jgi:fatty acid desaturase